jgi:hypothetical protein
MTTWSNTGSGRRRRRWAGGGAAVALDDHEALIVHRDHVADVGAGRVQPVEKPAAGVALGGDVEFIDAQHLGRVPGHGLLEKRIEPGAVAVDRHALKAAPARAGLAVARARRHPPCPFFIVRNERSTWTGCTTLRMVHPPSVRGYARMA